MRSCKLSFDGKLVADGDLALLDLLLLQLELSLCVLGVLLVVTETVVVTAFGCLLGMSCL